MNNYVREGLWQHVAPTNEERTFSLNEVLTHLHAYTSSPDDEEELNQALEFAIQSATQGRDTRRSRLVFQYCSESVRMVCLQIIPNDLLHDPIRKTPYVGLDLYVTPDGRVYHIGITEIRFKPNPAELELAA